MTYTTGVNFSSFAASPAINFNPQKRNLATSRTNVKKSEANKSPPIINITPDDMIHGVQWQHRGTNDKWIADHIGNAIAVLLNKKEIDQGILDSASLRLNSQTNLLTPDAKNGYSVERIRQTLSALTTEANKEIATLSAYRGNIMDRDAFDDLWNKNSTQGSNYFHYFWRLYYQVYAEDGCNQKNKMMCLPTHAPDNTLWDTFYSATVTLNDFYESRISSLQNSVKDLQATLDDKGLKH